MKSQEEAEEAGDVEWQLNASVLVAQAQGNHLVFCTVMFQIDTFVIQKLLSHSNL